MSNTAKPELEQLVDTFRTITEDDLTEPLLPKMRTLIGRLEHRSDAMYEVTSRTPQPLYIPLDRTH